MLEPGDLLPLELRELDAGVFVSPLLTESACARLLGDIERRQHEPGRARRPPNSMHDHGTMLEPLGLAPLVDELLDAHGLRAAIAERFGGHGGATLDGHHSYLVDYSRDTDGELGFHVDDSEVTLNLCLGDDFSGAELVMLGRRCDLHRQSPLRPGESLEIVHEPGTCVLHLGRHRHRVDPILRGRRRNLIAWLRSSRLRDDARHAALRCAPWCGDWCEDARSDGPAERRG